MWKSEFFLFWQYTKPRRASKTNLVRSKNSRNHNGIKKQIIRITLRMENKKTSAHMHRVQKTVQIKRSNWYSVSNIGHK